MNIYALYRMIVKIYILYPASVQAGAFYMLILGGDAH